jgi:hypothetical protein
VSQTVLKKWTENITHDWCYAYWLAIDCMHDRLIGMEVPWRVCVSVGVCVEWTLLLVLSVDGGTSALGLPGLGVLPVPVIDGFRRHDGTICA